MEGRNTTASGLNTVPQVSPVFEDVAATSSSSVVQHQPNLLGRQAIQHQLVLLLHGYKCTNQDLAAISAGVHRQCTLPHCETMKSVLSHLRNCQAGRTCAFKHCFSSRRIISHWKNCMQNTCPICSPLKEVDRNNISSATSTAFFPSEESLNFPLTDISNALSALCISDQTTTDSVPASEAAAEAPPQQAIADQLMAVPTANTKEWQQYVAQEKRDYFINSLVHTLAPALFPERIWEADMRQVTTFAVQIEADFFKKANSRAEYYHLLAEKIYRTQGLLEERMQQLRATHQEDYSNTRQQR